MVATDQQVAWLGSVFGPRGVQLLSRVEVLASDEAGPAHTLIANAAHKPNCIQVVFPRKQETDPFIFVHEMAHAYHALHFPHLTEVTTVDRAEACALLAEDTLSALHDDLDTLAAGRLKAWTQSGKVSEPIEHARRIVARAVSLRWRNDVPLHKLFELILFGVLDDNETGRAEYQA